MRPILDRCWFPDEGQDLSETTEVKDPLNGPWARAEDQTYAACSGAPVELNDGADARRVDEAELTEVKHEPFGLVRQCAGHRFFQRGACAEIALADQFDGGGRPAPSEDDGEQVAYRILQRFVA